MDGVDTNRVHAMVIEYFEGEIAKREQYLAREIDLLSVLDPSERMSTQTMCDLRGSLTEVRKRSHAHESLLFYMAEAGPVLDEYVAILNTPIKTSFMHRRKKVSPEQSRENAAARTDAVRRFMRIAAKYTNGEGPLELSATHDTAISSDDTCEECGSVNVVFSMTDSVVTCMDCGVEVPISDTIVEIPYTTNNEDNAMSSNGRYEAIIHFRNSMLRYQGRQVVTINDDVYSDLNDKFEEHNLLGPERYTRITREHIIYFLREPGHTDHYEDIMLIHHTITGLTPPNIAHLEPILEQEFQQLMSLYHQEYVLNNNHIMEDGKSFKSTYYILWCLLRKHHHPCKRSDFTNMLKTPDREIFYDLVCKDLFQRLGWEFISDF